MRFAGTAALLAAALGLAGCGDGAAPKSESADWQARAEPPPELAEALRNAPALPTVQLMPTAADAAVAPTSQREQVLGAFLDRHWRVPIPVQGDPPAGWSAAEASLDPAVCGACHPAQYQAWRGSLHAAAFSPGFSGQLLEGGLSEPAEVRQCQTCHTPLGEQQPTDAAGVPSPHFDPALRAQGMVCAVCHVRGHRVFGPPRRAELPPLADSLPHGGFEARTEYLESRFCAACHQFFDDPGVNGKPIENTFAEWQASPQAAAGRSCQSCHMPDRAHQWRGIHDPQTVRGAVDVELVLQAAEGAGLRAALLVRNRDVGHAFPTYVTPRVALAVWQVREDGGEIDGSRMQAMIGREVDFGSWPWREVFDTRVLPGESVKLDYAQPRRPGAVGLVGRVTVIPDYHYRGVFEGLLPNLEGAEARKRIAEAARQTSLSSYVLEEVRRALAEVPGG